MTPNGYDLRWVQAINATLGDRGSDLRIDDITDELWNRFIGPMIDAIEASQERTVMDVADELLQACDNLDCALAEGRRL